MYIDSSKLTENVTLRAMARQQLKGNWGKSILVFVLFGIIVGIGGAIPYAGVIISLVIGGPMTLGLAKYFIKLKRGEGPNLEDLFDGFKNFVPSLVLYILIAVFTFLWSLLFIIPGIIAALRYSQAFFILNDNPGMDAMQALNMSKEMMKGNKGKLFLLYLSFIGWFLLSCITFGIGFLWFYPYVQTASANFYDDLKSAAGGRKDEVISEQSVDVVYVSDQQADEVAEDTDAEEEVEVEPEVEEEAEPEDKKEE